MRRAREDAPPLTRTAQMIQVSTAIDFKELAHHLGDNMTVIIARGVPIDGMAL